MKLFIFFLICLGVAIFWLVTPAPKRRGHLAAFGWMLRTALFVPLNIFMCAIATVVPTAGVEEPRNGDWLSSEASGQRSRDWGYLVAINDGASVYPSGTVLGKQVVGSAGVFAITTGAANTTCGTIALSAGAQEGVYTGTYITGASATSEFELQAPSGLLLVSGKIGTAYSGGGLGFTLTDGGTHPAVGDQFTITVGAAVFSTNGGDTGDPTCSAIVVDSDVVGGVYNITMTDATHFTVTDPNARALSAGVFGTQYNDGGLSFTMTAGGAACVAGDGFKITASTAPGNWTAVNASATDGSQIAAAVLWERTYLGGSANVKVGIVTRSCEAKLGPTPIGSQATMGGILMWPSGATQDQVLGWVDELKAIGIIARPSQV